MQFFKQYFGRFCEVIHADATKTKNRIKKQKNMMKADASIEGTSGFWMNTITTQVCSQSVKLMFWTVSLVCKLLSTTVFEVKLSTILRDT